MNELINKDSIENMIYEIRGNQVMLDSDLAILYQCKNGTKEINQAVKNNLGKFPERFSWILTDEEYLNLRSNILTSKTNTNHGGRRYNPRVFTEQGVAMLATILKTPIATEISIKIMDAFIAMRKYISTNLLEQKYIKDQVIKNTEDIKLLQESFQKLEEKKKINEIFFAGQIFDAYSLVLEIFKSAKKELIIIDAYADIEILKIIKRLKVNVILITKENGLLSSMDIKKYNEQYNNLNVVYDNTYHDRYFIIDRIKVYHCGTSINRIGYKTFSINLISDKEVTNSLIDKIKKCNVKNLNS